MHHSHIIATKTTLTKIFTSSQKHIDSLLPSHSSINKMKIKIVVRVASMNDEKIRSKALKISVGFSVTNAIFRLTCSTVGVDQSAALTASKDQVVVIGENIDAVELTRKLRKRVGCADLVRMGEVKKEDKPPAKAEAPASAPALPFVRCQPPYVVYNTYPAVYEGNFNDPSCTIL